jgi:DNA-binding beta-propeller fold protein YncE
MTIALEPPGTTPDRRRRYLLIFALLVFLFLGSVAVFTFLIRQGAAPRAGLPSVLGGDGGRPRFDAAVQPIGRPVAVGLSPDGKKIYVAESAGAYGVQVFDRDGEPLEPLNPPHTTETTRQPMAIAVAQDGGVYVADRRHNQVFVYDEDGTYRDVLKPEGVEAWAPVAVAIDSQGLIYVTEALDLPEAQRHKVWVLDADGNVVSEFGQRGDASSDLMFPGSVTVDDRGRIWVGDFTGVKIFSQSGQYLFRLRTEGDGAVALPGGMATRADRVYISDTINHRIVVYKTTPDAATYEMAFGQLGFAKSDFRYPSGIAVSASRIYIADRENGRVDIWTR